MRMRKSNAGKTKHTHVRVGEFKNSLREENQGNGKPNKQDARGASGRIEKETEK